MKRVEITRGEGWDVGPEVRLEVRWSGPASADEAVARLEKATAEAVLMIRSQK